MIELKQVRTEKETAMTQQKHRHIAKMQAFEKKAAADLQNVFNENENNIKKQISKVRSGLFFCSQFFFFFRNQNLLLL